MDDNPYGPSPESSVQLTPRQTTTDIRWLRRYVGLHCAAVAPSVLLILIDQFKAFDLGVFHSAGLAVVAASSVTLPFVLPFAAISVLLLVATVVWRRGWWKLIVVDCLASALHLQMAMMFLSL